MLEDWMDTVLLALSRLRTGAWKLDGSRDERTLAELYTALNDLQTRLVPRLEGLGEALVRAHRDAGGTVGELGRALDCPRSSAQYRIERLGEPPRYWEDWATGELARRAANATEPRTDGLPVDEVPSDLTR